MPPCMRILTFSVWWLMLSLFALPMGAYAEVSEVWHLKYVTYLLDLGKAGEGIFTLGGESGVGGTNLLMKLSADGRYILIDEETLTAGTGKAHVEVSSLEPTKRRLVLRGDRPVRERKLTFSVKQVSPTRLVLYPLDEGATRNSSRYALHLLPAPAKKKLPRYRIAGVAGANSPGSDVEALPLSDLWAKFEMNDDYYNLAWQLLRANARPTGQAIFAMGNSTLREGLDSDQLSDITGIPVHKLGFSGASEFESLAAFRKLDLRQGDIFLLHIHPGDFTQAFSPDPEYCFREADWDWPPNPINDSRQPFTLFVDPFTYSQFTPPLYSLDEDASISLVLKDCFAFYRMRFIWQVGMRSGFVPETWKEIRYSGRDKSLVRRVRSVAAGYPAIARVDNTMIDDDNTAVKALRLLAEEARERGVRLLVLEAPINRWVWGSFYDDETRSAMDRLSNELGIVPAPFALFTDEGHYIDHNHLNAEGRRIYTDWLGELLKPYLSNSSDGGNSDAD